jgi:hypothetical protein
MTTHRNLFALLLLTLTSTSVLACDPPEASDSDGAEDFRFLLPTVCASPLADDVFVSDFACDAEDWQVCEPGEYHANATQRVCCVSEEECRIALNQDAFPCYGTETNPCDRSPFNNVHACLTEGGDIYTQEPYCGAAHTFLCAEAEFSKMAVATAVCCDFESPQNCELVNAAECTPFQHHVCDVGA